MSRHKQVRARVLETPPERKERLQKLLAAAGLGSRRDCEELILAGRVQVDGRTVTELGSKASLEEQEVTVDGVPLARTKRVYYLVNKPRGVISTNFDPSGRPRVIDLVGDQGRLFTVGRLDMSSEGLIVVTNDGPLAHRLTHPRFGVEKTYVVEIAGMMDKGQLARLQRGVHLAEGFAHVKSARVKRQYSKSTLLEIVLAEGRNREIRRILARAGHKVLRLRRIAIGPLRLGELPSGHVRLLLRDEVRRLRQAAKAPAESTGEKAVVGSRAKPRPRHSGGSKPKSAKQFKQARPRRPT